jgi:aryl-alcohol dehydrogenase-like predicted oxidoreductase
LTKYAEEELGTGEHLDNRYSFQHSSRVLNAGIIQLALAYIVQMPNTGTIILGASSPQQLEDQLKTIDVLPKINDAVREKVEAILDNKPKLKLVQSRL